MISQEYFSNFKGKLPSGPAGYRVIAAKRPHRARARQAQAVYDAARAEFFARFPGCKTGFIARLVTPIPKSRQSSVDYRKWMRVQTSQLRHMLAGCPVSESKSRARAEELRRTIAERFGCLKPRRL